MDPETSDTLRDMQGGRAWRGLQRTSVHIEQTDTWQEMQGGSAWSNLQTFIEEHYGTEIHNRETC
jgi:hypothetical protein